MNSPDYKYIAKRSLKVHDMLSVLTFETYFHDAEGDKLVREACSAIAKLFKYSQKMEKKNESEV